MRLLTGIALSLITLAAFYVAISLYSAVGVFTKAAALYR